MAGAHLEAVLNLPRQLTKYTQSWQKPSLNLGIPLARALVASASSPLQVRKWQKTAGSWVRVSELVQQEDVAVEARVARGIYAHEMQKRVLSSANVHDRDLIACVMDPSRNPVDTLGPLYPRAQRAYSRFFAEVEARIGLSKPVQEKRDTKKQKTAASRVYVTSRRCLRPPTRSPATPRATRKSWASPIGCTRRWSPWRSCAVAGRSTTRRRPRSEGPQTPLAS